MTIVTYESHDARHQTSQESVPSRAGDTNKRRKRLLNIAGGRIVRAAARTVGTGNRRDRGGLNHQREGLTHGAVYSRFGSKEKAIAIESRSPRA